MMEEDKSKSQAKRDAQALKELGAQLSLLSHRQLDQIPLPSALLEAILATKKITSHLAKKRHIQYIGALMRKLSAEEQSVIVGAYQSLKNSADVNSPRFRLIEGWRTRLLSDDAAALTAFLSEYQCPQQSQKLRQLIVKAKRELQQSEKSVSSTALFRLIRDLIP